MKIVLTCGHPYSGFELAHAALVAAGLEQARPSRRELLAATELQSKILAACEVGSILSESVTQLSPGKMWQALALDLMMANLEADCWGWGDASTARLLDFWADIDGQVRYVLVYSSPEFALGQMLRNRVVCPESVGKALAEWSAFNTELLRFYNRQRERCFLVNSKALLHETARFVNDVTAGLGLGISQLPVGYQPDVSGVSTVACGLAKGLVEDHRGSSALYRELEGSADLTSAALSEPRSEEISAWIEYLASLSNIEQTSAALRKAAETSLQERGEFEQHLNEAKREIDERSAQLADANASLSGRVAELSALQAGNSSLMAENANLVSSLESRNAEVTQLQRKNAELIERSELLASQFRQAQEEASKRAVELAEVMAALSRRDSEVASLQAGSKGLMLENESLVSSLSMKSADIAQLESRNAALKQESELLVDQCRQAQEEASKHAAELAEVKAALSRRDSELASLQAGSKGLMLENESLVTSLSMKSAEIAQLHSRNEILVQENELFALQVSQAHEELEQVCRSGVVGGSGGGQQQGAQTSVNESAPLVSKPDGVMIDLRGDMEGENWYYAEHDGRWAGPGEESTLLFSSPRQGSYELLLDVVDAMEPEILRDMTVFLNGKPLALGGRGQERCGLFSARFATNEIEDRRIWELRLKFPKLVSPAIHGHDDRRILAIRVKSLQLRALDRF